MSSFEQYIRLVSVKVNYPDGLEEMVHGFKLCATARLFLQDSIPHVDAGVFLDNDIVVMDDLSLLWDRFKLFSTEAAMAMAPVEAHYGVRMVRVFTNTCPSLSVKRCIQKPKYLCLA